MREEPGGDHQMILAMKGTEFSAENQGIRRVGFLEQTFQGPLRSKDR